MPESTSPASRVQPKRKTIFMPSANDVAAAYDRWASTYDIDANQTRELAGAVLRQQNFKLTDRNVIEIGCATGRNTQWLIEHGAQIVALDFSAGMVPRLLSIHFRKEINPNAL